MVLIRMIPPRNRSRPPPRVPPEWRKALREYAFEQERGTVTSDTHGQGDIIQNLPMNTNTYQIKQHADGYQVIATGGTVGISTHANILDALAACRAANRYIRSLTK